MGSQARIGGKLISGSYKWGFDVPFVTLGRSVQSIIRVDDPTASRLHCVLRMDDHGKYWVIDWGSTHGTRVNGKRIGGPVLLQTGDVLAIGQQEFHFVGNEGPGLGKKHTSHFISATGRREGQQVHVSMMAVSLMPRRVMPVECSGWVFGQWARRQQELVQASGGVFDKLTPHYQLSYWDAAEQIPNGFDGLIDVARQCLAVLHQVVADGVGLHGLNPDDPPFATAVGLHQGYATLHRLGSEHGETFAVLGEEVEVTRDVMLRAGETQGRIACTEMFVGSLSQPGAALPFCLATVGPRQRSLLLHQIV